MKSLFIHIPKTGGKSIARALYLRVFNRGVKEPPARVESLKERFNEWENTTFRHVLYKNLRKHKIISDEFHNDSFKFTFCRNPYDRAVSHWKYTMRRHPGRLPRGTSFLDFTRELGNRRDWIPQHTWVDGVDLDFIGRFENFEDDVYLVGDLIGVMVERIPKINTTKHDHYSTYYCDESRQRVEDYYEKDFEYFGYELERVPA